MKKIAVLVGVLMIVMGTLMFSSVALAQTLLGVPLPNVPLPEQQQEEIQLPDYSDWQVIKAVGTDTDLDGRTNFYQKTLVKKEAQGEASVTEMLHMYGKFGQEPELVIWMATKRTSQGTKPMFARGIIRRDDGKYYEVSPPVFKAKAKEFFESFPKYAK